MEDKIEFIDDFLMRCEDWMHGEDGNDVTTCRKYINEIREQVKTCSIPDVSQQRKLLKAYNIHLFTEYSNADYTDFDIDEFLKAFNCG